MKKSFIYFVLILSNLFAQSFTGYIKDVSGEPVSFVIIEEINSNLEEKNWAISDENGVFTINVQSNSQLSFDRFGFESTKLNENKDIAKPSLASRQKIKRINSIDEFEKRNNEIPI